MPLNFGMGGNPMMAFPPIPNFGLGPNDNMNMFNSMLNIFNNNSFMNPTTTNGQFPGPRMPAPSPFIFQDRGGNNMNNMNMMNNPMMNMMMNMNMLMNNMNNNIFRSFENMSLEKKDVKRDESLEVKMDIDNILKNKNDLEEKNKNVQYILNYIPFTIIKDAPKSTEDEPHCLICLSDFEVNEKVSALPCCHCFHTKCLDEWIVRSAKCPICKFEITLKNLIGEDIIKEHMKKLETKRNEEGKERKEKERKEKERIEKERKEKERKEKERKEKERIEKERKEKERIEKERKEKDRKEKEDKQKNGEKKTVGQRKRANSKLNVKKIGYPTKFTKKK